MIAYNFYISRPNFSVLFSYIYIYIYRYIYRYRYISIKNVSIFSIKNVSVYFKMFQSSSVENIYLQSDSLLNIFF